MRKAFDLKPLGFGDVMGRGFSLYATAFLAFARWFLLAWTLPMLLLTALLYLVLDPYSSAVAIEDRSIWKAGEYAGYHWLLKLASLVLALSVGAAGLYYTGARLYVGGKPGLAEVARAIAARTGALVGSSLFTVLLLLGTTLLCFGWPLALIFDDDIALGILLALMLSFIWFPLIGLYIGFWGLAVPATVLDDVGAVESFSRGMFLSRGFRMRLIGVVVTGVVIVGAPGVPGLMTVPAVVLQSLLGGGGYAIVGDLARIAWEGFLLPLFFVPFVAYYFDMRCRKEGYDLAVMARNFGIQEGEMMRYRMNPHAGYAPPGYKPQARRVQPAAPRPAPVPVASTPEWAPQPQLRLPRRRR